MERKGSRFNAPNLEGVLAIGSWHWVKNWIAPNSQTAQSNQELPVDDNAYALYQRRLG